MPDVNTTFNGQTLIIPGAYYGDDVTAALATNPANTPPMVFVGNGYGMKPQTPITFADAQSLVAALRGGPASGFVPFIFNPSGQLNGARLVTFINVAENTQSSLTLSASTTGVISLTSLNYGLPSNLLQAQVQTGSTAGKKLSLYDGFSGAGFSGDNLGVPFELAYTGTASGVTYSVLVSGGAATEFITQSSNTGESIAVNLQNYPTVENLIQYLNGTGFYSALNVSQTGGAGSTSGLDQITSGALASGVPLQYANVTATLADMVFWVNQFGGGLATAAIVSGITSAPALAPSNMPFTPFTGGTNVPPTLSDYASGFNVALGIPGWTIFADNNSSGVVALGAQHAITASETANGHWRRFFTGSSVGDTSSSAISGALACNSITSTYAFPGITRVDTNTGLNTTYGGLYVAAAAAAMAAGNPPATPLTNKSLLGTGVEQKLTVAQVNTLQQAGVMPVWVSPQTGVPVIISDLTTWQNDNNPENVFNQQVACRFQVAYTMVNTLQPYIGTIADLLNEIKIRNAAKSALNALIYSPNNAQGVIASWDPDSLIITYDGSTQTAAVTVNVVLVGQNRFITIFVSILPLNLTITSAAA